MQNQNLNNQQQLFQPNPPTGLTITTKQINKIKWNSYFSGFAIWFLLTITTLAGLVYLLKSTSFKINNKEINFLLAIHWQNFWEWIKNEKRLPIIASISTIYLAWPILIVIIKIVNRTKLPQVWDATLLIAKSQLEKIYNRHCIIFWIIWALPILFIFWKIIKRKRAKK